MATFNTHPVYLTWRLENSPADQEFTGFAADRAQTGPCYLRRPEIARMVVDTIQSHANQLRHYDLHAYVVMANHVHLLLTPHVPVPELARSLRQVTATEASRIMQVAGPFWQDECYDRTVPDATELQHLASDIEMEPVIAGMVSTPGEFPWTSAQAD